jgi:hypothetical protein
MEVVTMRLLKLLFRRLTHRCPDKSSAADQIQSPPLIVWRSTNWTKSHSRVTKRQGEVDTMTELEWFEE